MQKLLPRGKPFAKGHKGGRPPGVQNKITTTVKEKVLAVFNEIQDDPKVNLKKFAQKYPRDFYAIAAKLIPTEIHARINKVELHVIRTGKDLPENFTPAATENNGHGETIQYSEVR